MIDSGGRLVSPRLVGRSRELELVTGALAAPPAVAVVEGEAGVGKTRLVTELAEDPALATSRLLVGGCQWIRDPFPLGPVLEALRTTGADLSAASLPAVTGALRPLLPELVAVLPPLPEPLGNRAGEIDQRQPRAGAELHRVFRGLVDLFTALGPVVLVLEDLHWADEQTVDFLTYLTTGRLPASLGLVLTYRAEEVPADVRALPARLPAPVRRAHAVLEPLDQESTGALAAAILQTPQVASGFAADLWRRTSGLPFAVEELLALLHARGDLTGGEAGAPGALPAVTVPTAVRDHVWQRVDRLLPPARAVVEVTAALYDPAPAEVVTAACPLPADQAPQGLAEALASGVLVEHDGRVGLRHQLAAQAVYEATPSPRRQDLHRRAAAALREQHPEWLGQLAYHLWHAGDRAGWVTVAEHAADRALELGHYDEALRLLEDLLRHHAQLAPDQLTPERCGDLATKLARVSSIARHGRRAVPLLTELCEQLPAGTARSEVRMLLALSHESDPGRRYQVLTEVFPDCDHRPELQARVAVSLGLPAAPGVPLAEHRQWLRRALALMPSVPDRASRVLVLGKAAMTLAGVGDPDWRDLVDRMLHTVADRPREFDEVNACYSVAPGACYLGHYHMAERLLAAAGQGVDPHSPWLALAVRAATALLDYCRGAWQGLAATIDVLDSEAESRAGIRELTRPVRASLALARGDDEDAGAWLAAAAAQAHRANSLDALPFATAAEIRWRLTRGEVDAAADSAQSCIEANTTKEVWAPLARALPWLAEALVRAGRAGQAQELVDEYAARLPELDAPLGDAALRHARGELAAATDPRRAARAFDAAATRYESLQCPYEAAQAREQAGRCLHQAGMPAGEALRRALGSYQRLGADGDRDRTAQYARQAGVSVPARHRGGRRSYGNALTPREREVAQLAAHGRANQQIAAALFISVKTVEWHLTAAMRKLGVRSRAAIIHRLADEPPASVADG